MGEVIDEGHGKFQDSMEPHQVIPKFRLRMLSDNLDVLIECQIRSLSNERPAAYAIRTPQEHFG